MTDAPVLMKNTDTGAYFIYVEKTVKAVNNLIPIFEAQVTPEIEEQAGLVIGHFSKREEVAAPAPAPVVEKKDPVVTQIIPSVTRPSTDGLDLQGLLALVEKYDIPVHPAAKETGLITGINRYFDLIEKEKELDGPITGNAGEGNQSTGNG